jgi:hypothetical protein
MESLPIIAPFQGQLCSDLQSPIREWIFIETKTPFHQWSFCWTDLEHILLLLTFAFFLSEWRLVVEILHLEERAVLRVQLAWKSKQDGRFGDQQFLWIGRQGRSEELKQQYCQLLPGCGDGPLQNEILRKDLAVASDHLRCYWRIVWWLKELPDTLTRNLA